MRRLPCIILFAYCHDGYLLGFLFILVFQWDEGIIYNGSRTLEEYEVHNETMSFIYEENSLSNVSTVLVGGDV